MSALLTAVRGRSIVATLRQWPRHSPVTVGAIAVFLSHAAFSGHLWPLTSFIASLLSVLLVGTVGLLIERRMGSVRTALSLAVTLTAAALSLLVDTSSSVLTGPTMWSWVAVAGLAAAYSGGASPLWARRIRVALVATLLVWLIPGTSAGPTAAPVAGVAGLALGRWLGARTTTARWGSEERSRPDPLVSGSLREGRALVAIVFLALALGPIIVTLLHAPGMALSDAGSALTTLHSADELAQMCSPAPDPGTVQAQRCLAGHVVFRNSGSGPLVFELVPAISALVVANGLRRGRLAALVIACLWCLTQLASDVLLLRIVRHHHLDTAVQGAVTDSGVWATLAITTVALVGLLAALPLFPVRTPACALRRALRQFAVLLGGGFVVWTAGAFLVRTHFSPLPSLGQIIEEFPWRLLTPSLLSGTVSSFLPTSPVATILFEYLGVVITLVGTVVLATLLRGREAGEASPEEVERLRELLRTVGGSRLSWMSTWKDNHIWFSEDGQAAVAYRLVGSVALSVTDPISTVQRRGEVVADWAQWCARRGLSPCLYSVDSSTRATVEALGWKTARVAEEAVLPLEGYAFKGKKFQDLRTAVNRAGKEGVSAEHYRWSSAPTSVQAHIIALSQEWVSDKGLPEMGFTLGGILELDDDEVDILVARDAAGVVHGVTSWLPVYRDGVLVGRTLDVMRRRADGFRPVVEFLIASAVKDAQAEGLEFLSLSGAPLATSPSATAAGGNRFAAPTVGPTRGEVTAGATDVMTDDVNDEGSLPALLPLLDILGRALEPVYGFRSLQFFKAKFHPTEEPMFLCVPSAAYLAGAGVAVGRSYVPDLSAREAVALLTALVRGDGQARTKR